MFCPIVSSVEVGMECGRDKCAWWKRTDGVCSILSIATDLTLLYQIENRKEEREIE